MDTLTLTTEEIIEQTAQAEIEELNFDQEVA
jgi:hypothetical protein